MRLSMGWISNECGCRPGRMSLVGDDWSVEFLTRRERPDVVASGLFLCWSGGRSGMAGKVSLGAGRVGVTMQAG